MTLDNNLPLVSIIVGMYNGEKYIHECIDSIINQDYKNIELILIDDGSPDDCYKIATQYAKKDKRVYVYKEKNSGVSASRNLGMSKASGDYVGIVDQDDILAPNYVSYFVHLLYKYKAEIATTPQPDKFFKKINNNRMNDDHIKVYSGHEASENMLYHKWVIAPWNKIISAKLIKENNIKFNPAFFGGEGFAFSVECFEHAKRVAVGQAKVYHYRVGDPNSGASKFRVSSIISSINAQKYIKEHLVEKSASLLKAWRFSNWHTYCDCLNMMIGCDAENVDPQLYKKLFSYCKQNANVAFNAPISAQQKLRGILFSINPKLASKVINHFRIRKFSKI